MSPSAMFIQPSTLATRFFPEIESRQVEEQWTCGMNIMWYNLYHITGRSHFARMERSVVKLRKTKIRGEARK